MSDHFCPECGSRGITGYEISGLYDGVLFWECDRCKHAWPRDFGVARRLNQYSREYATRQRKYNEQRLREDT